MGEEEKIIKELNEKGHFKVEKLEGTLMKVKNLHNREFIVDYTNTNCLRIINEGVGKQTFKNLKEIENYPADGQILSNLRFEFVYANGFNEWSHICKTANDYVFKTENPYSAVIRLTKTGKDKFVITTIDRNRVLWGI